MARPGERLRRWVRSMSRCAVAHSIPKSIALAIRTPVGTVVHSGDWKIDPTPVLGKPTDGARFSALGDEGVLALICNLTNRIREGVSPSEPMSPRSWPR
ncbi:MAG: hypothetical protein QM722_01605 [Piscinibacter sp.]